MNKLTNATFRGSWAGVPVPWTADDKFDEQVYRGDIARCCRLGVPGIYTAGTTGEFYAMDFDEFRRVTKATIEEAHAAGKPAMIGVSSTYTLGAAKRAAYAAEVGADAVQVALPFWLEVPDAEVPGFFKEVSSAAGGLPLSVYETSRTKKALTLDLHRAIKSAVPNYLVVKATCGIGLTPKGCEDLTKLGINVFVDESSWPELGPHGLVGACSSFVYYVPDIVLPSNEDLAKRNWTGLAKRAKHQKKLLDFVVKEFVIGRNYLDSAMDRLGGVAGGVLRTSLRCRPPYPYASDEDVRVLREWFRTNMPEVFAGIEAKLALR